MSKSAPPGTKGSGEKMTVEELKKVCVHLSVNILIIKVYNVIVFTFVSSLSLV